MAPEEMRASEDTSLREEIQNYPISTVHEFEKWLLVLSVVFTEIRKFLATKADLAEWSKAMVLS